MKSRSEWDHKYNTSEKGRERRRRYDQSAKVRGIRRNRDLAKGRETVLEALTQVRKELAQFERVRN